MADANQEGGEPVARIVIELDQKGFLGCQFDVPDKKTFYAMMGMAREKMAVDTARVSVREDLKKKAREKRLEVVGPDGAPPDLKH